MYVIILVGGANDILPPFRIMTSSARAIMKTTQGSKLTQICSLKWLYHEIFNQDFKKTKKIETNCFLKDILSLPHPIFLSSIFVFYSMHFNVIIVVFNLYVRTRIHAYLGLQCPNFILRCICHQKLRDNCSRKPFLTLLYVPIAVTGPQPLLSVTILLVCSPFDPLERDHLMRLY